MSNVLWAVAAILIALWVAGMATSYTMGGLVHVLLILAIIAVAFRLISGRRVV
jgi:hypothetical protein